MGVIEDISLVGLEPTALFDCFEDLMQLKVLLRLASDRHFECFTLLTVARVSQTRQGLAESMLSAHTLKRLDHNCHDFSAV